MRSAMPYNPRPLANFCERLYTKQNTMTDQNPPGAPVAPAADTPAPAASAEPLPAATFGSGRGSGLARGKRSSSVTAPSAAPVKADYKPTAVQVITPAREYKNPFASPEPANVPVSEPAQAEGAAAPEVKTESQPEASPAQPAPALPAHEEPSPAKPEIQILPPAESNRPAVSWESPSAASPLPGAQRQDLPERDTRDGRPSFRPERRGESYGANQQGDGRDFRRDSFRRQPRDPRDEFPRRDEGARAPATTDVAQKPAAGGFFGWLKGLFGGKKPVETPVEQRDPAAGQFGDGQRHRRRHRGGRRHGGGGGGGPQGFRGDSQGYRGESQGFRGDQGPQGGGEFENRGGDREGGHRRRRHRGGRGRDRGREPRSEGQQGGGAI